MAIDSDLGSQVTTSTILWADLVQKAWGGEFRAPDHNMYKFSGGRGFDSTDRGVTGIYSPNNNLGLLIEGGKYGDMTSFILAEDTTQLDQN